MGKRNLYHAFFAPDRRYLPYEAETEYIEEQFAYLRMKLSAFEIFTEQRLKALSGEKDKETDFEPLTEAQVKNAVKSAKLHIHTRILNTKEKMLDFRMFCLMEQLEMGEFERFMFLMAFSVSYAADFGPVYQKLIGGRNAGLPSLQSAIELFRMGEQVSGEEIASAIERDSVFYKYFLETEEKPAQPTSYVFRLCDRACAWLFGRNLIQREFQDLLTMDNEGAETEPLPIRDEKKRQIVYCMQQTIQESMEKKQNGNVLQLYGPAGIGKRQMLLELGKAEEFHIIFVDLQKLLLATNEELRHFFRVLALECILAGAVPCFFGYEPIEFGEEFEIKKEQPQGLSFIYEELRSNYQLAIWLSEEKADYLLAEKLHLTFIELPLLSAKEREILWREETRELALEEDVSLTVCASQYILTPKSLKEVVRDAGMRAGFAGRGISKEDIREAVAAQVKNQLGSMATHIRSIYTWNDLVIGDKEREQLKNICDQVRYRGVVGEEWGFYKKTAYGRGLCAMFYGQPGTGKTMAAQVIANELGLELYRIDLSQMVSKYIGETQKNVTKLFERAKNTNAILFFDEADSLFSKRSEVKDSHDRNANAETAHLLQKLEDYEGITILATNYANNIDDAFKRRIKFMVNFVFPEAEVRRELWKTILPDTVPTEESLDLDFFADEFELSGSSIKEILTNAAFLAAAKGRGLKNEDLVEAVKANFEKHGKILTEKDFGYLG